MAKYEDLEGKIVLITGGSGDLGRASVLEFGKQKCRVYFTYNSSKDSADELVASAEESGFEAFPIRCNISDKEQVNALVNDIVEKEGKIDVLVNNAGIYKDNLFTSMTDEEFEQVIQTNLYGTFYCTKSVVDVMYRNRCGAIVNVSSIAGVTNSFGQANYSAAKGAVVSFSRTLAAELAPKNIRVNTVAPGLIDSSMVKRIPRNIMKQTLSGIPVKRLGKPEEIAKAIAFLASEDSSYVVGQTLIADGGLIMR
ncbi:3-oxoacyl-ACP reductase FabG [Bermanella marisrubri]|uniref:Putative fatty acyl chain reductase n=1 Tax=Bermanella marisrubri TaxID=207949 RepID=Q1N373_9GAMM|nr:3-oxoacyl-ACP reductase family protein [Bermanella marisrubri]EAT12718.1 putative fatty acyl chain reductase [Oceanobacter sp. RED65] [Bermanella marisrubri]QIZ85163.1 3-oxoacyl-ACP reductase FabG [Bermanella marisrubri]